MAGARPTSTFSKVKLETATIEPVRRFGRLYFGRYPDPVGFGKTPSRFSAPRRRLPSNRFAVIYLGESLKACFLEALLRDLRNGVVGDFPLAERELHIRQYAEIVVARALKLVDLRSDAAIRMGVPSDVAGASRQSLPHWRSVAFHEHPEQPDGIIHRSRLNAEANLAIYDRAISKLRVHRVTALINAKGLADVLEELKVALVPSKGRSR
jgi:RES domain-containing protein